MRERRCGLVGSLRVLAAGAALAVCLPAAAQLPPRVAVCELDGTVDGGSSAYLQRCVDEAGKGAFDALLITIDTPGGSLEATREIVRAFLASEVPLLVWVGPAGARAGSAGVFLTLAAHVAGMAPATNIGAAHPVVGPSGADPEEAGGKEMARKIENDTVAFAEAIARQRGRNVEWAAKAVRESASVEAEKAVELNVVDVIAPTKEAFLAAAHGRTVKVPSGEVTLRTENAQLTAIEPTLGQRIAHGLANPAVAYILLMVGVLGLAIEFYNPGGIVPGLVGVVAMVLAMIAMSALPLHLGGVALVVLGVGLLAAEIFVGSGLLAAGGVLLLGLGGALLIDRVDPSWFVEPSFRVPFQVIVPVVLVVGGAAAWVAFKSAQTRSMPQLAGDAGILGETGRTLTEVGPASGEVFVHGERWSARAAGTIPAGAPIVVRRLEGLTVHVEEVKA